MLAFGAINPVAGACQELAGTALAMVQIEAHGTDGIIVLGEVIALVDVAVRAEMKVVRRGRSGNLVTSQSNDLEVAAGDRATVARLNLSFAPGDSLTVSVNLSHNGTVISTAAVTAGGEP